MVGTMDTLIIKQLYINSLKGIQTNITVLTRQLGLIKEIIEPIVSSLATKGSVKIKKEFIKLTPLGRKQITVVMTGGTFDILHVGHLFTFEQARLLGDVLVVVIATDENVKRLKKRPPTNSEDDRKQIVDQLKCVDVAVIGSNSDLMITVDFVEPDIIALGYDQSHNEKYLFNLLSTRGHSYTKIIRLKEYVPGKSTTKIVQDIIKHNYRE